MCERFVARPVEPLGLEDAWSDDEPVAHRLAAQHDGFGGEANLAIPTKDAIDSVDRSRFRNAGRGATDRVLTRLQSTIAHDERGRPFEAGPGLRARS